LAKSAKSHPGPRRLNLVNDKEQRVVTAEAAAVLGVRPDTLVKWRIFGKGPRYEKVGAKLVRYRYQDLLLWLEGQKRGGVR
jgi:hypothetical protein